MRILLPPSEGKTAPPAGPVLDLSALSFPALTATRQQVLGALVDLCRSDPDAALTLLGLGPTLADEVQRDADLYDAACATAWQVYTGVLFAALDPGTLPSRDRLLIASGLFGLLGADDPIPAYRLSGSVRLPGLPAPKSLWRSGLAAVLEGLAADHLLVDMRSHTYQSRCPPGTATIRVMTMRNGRRVSVSHHNKSTKGQLARALVLAEPAPADASDLVDVLRSGGWDASSDSQGAVEVLHVPPTA